ncbi:hypothetical protein [Hoeflea olei]|uniref:Antifreeze protein n=1 Tax=Hoeflea olei TaxID=1480615 RepID=A0A1C1YPU0_9HYPH|nr:hypothetical protein [Hoeflea olei]OCW55528.1 hypothetical protein AWJ14_05915 [Hoeflea olei]
MARRKANVTDIWSAWAGLGLLALEAQAVIGMRVMGMHGLWPVGKGEDRKMVSEKPPAFARSALAAAGVAASGGRPDQVLAAAVKPLTRVARANRKRLAGAAVKRRKPPKGRS